MTERYKTAIVQVQPSCYNGSTVEIGSTDTGDKQMQDKVNAMMALLDALDACQKAGVPVVRFSDAAREHCHPMEFATVANSEREMVVALHFDDEWTTEIDQAEALTEILSTK